MFPPDDSDGVGVTTGAADELLGAVVDVGAALVDDDDDDDSGL